MEQNLLSAPLWKHSHPGVSPLLSVLPQKLDYMKLSSVAETLKYSDEGLIIYRTISSVIASVRL